MYFLLFTPLLGGMEVTEITNQTVEKVTERTITRNSHGMVESVIEETSVSSTARVFSITRQAAESGKLWQASSEGALPIELSPFENEDVPHREPEEAFSNEAAQVESKYADLPGCNIL